MSESTGITERHARSCRSRSGGRCSCKPTYQAHVWDANAGKRIRKTFPTKSAAKRWRQDAYPALRAGELSADRGPILKEAAMAWIDGLRNGTITNRSGDAYKPVVVRDYDRIFRARILPALGHLCVG